jgi:ribosome-binding protein aMBF1 (putative translation factor)
MRRREEERKKALARQAAEIAEKYALDLEQYSEELPEEIRRELNPKNAGRKAVKWNSAYCEMLVERAAEGKSEAEFAAEINVAQSLIQNWTEKHPNFKKAREIANELRIAWFERCFRDAMLGKIICVPVMMNRYASAKLGWTDKSEVGISKGGREIPVVRIVDRDSGFPTETQAPDAEQAAAAGVEG